MEYVYSFILFFYLYNNNISYSIYYLIGLINPFLLIPSLIFIKPIIIIFVLLGIINHFFKSRIIHIISIILASIFNPFNLISLAISPFIFNKKLKLINVNYLYVYLITLILIQKSNVEFIILSLCFIFMLKNKKYTYIIGILGFLLHKNVYLLLTCLYNPLFNLIYLIYKCFIGLEIIDIELYFSIILYLLYVFLYKENKKIENNILINYFKKANEIFYKNNDINKSLDKMYFNVCKNCNLYIDCINNKNYLLHLKSIIKGNTIEYKCIYRNKLSKYKLNVSESIFINLIDSINILYKKVDNIKFLKIIGINDYTIIRNNKNDILIESNNEIPFYVKYVIYPFKYQVVNNFITNRLNYKINYQAFSYSKDSSIIKGDSYKVINNINNITFILADGMGYGIKACNESKSLIELIEVIEPLEIDKKLKILNNTYKYKNDESYSTLDYLNINKINLEAHLYKLGSSKSFIIRDNDIKTISNINAPLGFNEKIEESKITLKINDLIILLSDGLGDIKDIDEIILRFKNKNINKMVYDIINYSTNKLSLLNDDITLLILKIEK